MSTSRNGKTRSYLLGMLFLLVLMITTSGWSEYGDVILNNRSEQEGMRPVIYPHWFHRIRFRCKVCHQELGFKMKVGSNHIAMVDIVNGKFCGMCHNDEIAWGAEHCHRCHSGLPGLKTEIKGGDRTSGPGIW